MKQFIYCENCHKPLTGFIVKSKGLFYYKCRTKGCSCNKSAKVLHEKFLQNLSNYDIDAKYNSIIKDVMLYTYDNVTKEIRTQETQIKK